MVEADWMERLRAVKVKHEADLMQKPNVVGVGIGLRECGGELTDQAAIIVSVTHKVARGDISPGDAIPAELDGVPVDVQVVGRLRAL